MKPVSIFFDLRKTLLTSILVIAMVFSSTACHFQGSNESVDTKPDSIGGESVSTVLNIEAASEKPYFSNKTLDFITSDANQVYLSIKDTLLFGDNLAFLVNVAAFSYTESGDKTNSTDDYLLIYDSDGRQTATINTTEFFDADAENSFVLGLIPCNDFSISILINESISNEEDSTMTSSTDLCTIDTSGELVSSVSYMDREMYCEEFQVDSDGNLYCISFGLITVFDSEMSELFTIADEAIFPFSYNIDGVIYVTRNTFTGNASKMDLAPILPEEKGFGKDSTDITKYVNAGYTFQQGSDGIYAFYSDGLYKFDMATGTVTSSFSWSYTDYARYSNGGDEKLVPFSTDKLFVCGMDRSGSKDTAGLVLLTREDSNPNAGKTILTIGGIDTTKDPGLLTAVSLFNQTNTKYRFEIVDYASDMSMYGDTTDYDEMNSNLRIAVLLKIVSGNGTDILYGDSTHSLQTVEAHNNQVDLTTYLTKDPDITSDNYLINVMTALQPDGNLYQIITGFSVVGLAGANSKVGQKTGWTYEEFYEFTKSLPMGVDPILKERSQGELLTMACSSNMVQFIDFTLSDVYFDSDNFRQLLDFAKNYGVHPDDPDELYENKFQPLIDGSAVLLAGELSGPENYNDIEKKIFNESFSLMGFPSSSAIGPSINPSGIYSISSDCEYADAAWEFIKTVLSEESQEAITLGIPVNRNAIEFQIQEAMLINAADEMDINYSVESMNEETAARYRGVLDDLSNIYLNDSNMNTILEEEANAYFYEQKSAADVAALIQNRLQTLVFERE